MAVNVRYNNTPNLYPVAPPRSEECVICRYPLKAAEWDLSAQYDPSLRDRIVVAHKILRKSKEILVHPFHRSCLPETLTQCPTCRKTIDVASARLESPLPNRRKKFLWNAIAGGVQTGAIFTAGCVAKMFFAKPALDREFESISFLYTSTAMQLNVPALNVFVAQKAPSFFWTGAYAVFMYGFCGLCLKAEDGEILTVKGSKILGLTIWMGHFFMEWMINRGLIEISPLPPLIPLAPIVGIGAGRLVGMCLENTRAEVDETSVSKGVLCAGIFSLTALSIWPYHSYSDRDLTVTISLVGAVAAGAFALLKSQLPEIYRPRNPYL